MHRTLPISSIKINREIRQRRELVDLDTLAASISQVGLINPILINENLELVAGERRLEACRLLGWSDIPTQTRDDLDEATAQIIELEENIKRSELPWRDECAAVTNFFNLRREAEPEYSAEDCAQELSMSERSVYERLSIQQALDEGHELVIAADKFSVARNLVQRIGERRKASDEEALARNLGGVESRPASPSSDGEPRAEVVDMGAPVAPADPAPSAPILNEDFMDWAPRYDGPRFNLLHCDFPYGINADKHHQGAAKYYRGYEDSPDIYWALLATLGENLERLVADSAHLIFWYSLNFHHETKMALQQMGWRVDPHPLVWFKNDNTGILPDPQRGPRRIYETAFFASRGDRKVVQPVGNAFAAPVTKRIHMSEKNVSMLQHFYRMVVDDTTYLLDPTCGSANSLRAAKKYQPAMMLGLEKDPEFYERACEAWEEDEKELELDL